MDFSKIDFCHKAHVDLHVGAYGSLSGLFYIGKKNLVTLEQLFKDSHDWQPSFKHEGRQYVMGFVDPGNVIFQQFMQDEAEIERNNAADFYKQHGFHEQTHDFVDIWNDNDVSDVQISFPLLTTSPDK
jgi:hypothetical protein